MNRKLRVISRAAALMAVTMTLGLPSYSGAGNAGPGPTTPSPGGLGPPTEPVGPGGRFGRGGPARARARRQAAQQQPQQPAPQPQPQPRVQPQGPSVSQPTSRPPAANSRLEVISEAGGAKTIAMEFYGLDIDHLLRLLSYAAQVTIVKAEGVSGVITVIAPERVPLEVAFQILDSVLQVRGWTMVRIPTGIYKVIPVADAMQAGLPVQFGAKLGTVPPGDQLITQVVPLRNLSASDVASQLQSIVSPNAIIVPTSTNSIIITDTAANIHRALTLIESSENDLAGGLKVFRLRYYDASEMADLVSSIVISRGGGAGMAGPRPTWERRVVGRTAVPQRPGQRPQPVAPQVAAAGISTTGPEFAYPDTRTNSLIVLATPVHLGQIEEIISQLDRPVSLRDSYFVYPVQNLVASELADSIAPLIGAQVTRTGAGGERGTAGGTSGTTQRQRTDTTGGYTRPFGTQGPGGGYRQGTAALGAGQRDRMAPALQLETTSAESSSARSADPYMIAQAPEGAPPAQVAPQPERPGGEAPGAAEYPETAAFTSGGGAQPTIVADDNTNTLLISAAPEQIDLVEQMLEKLDVLPPQVHIRAIIAEVSLSRDTSLGFQWESIGRTWGTFGGDTFTGHIGTNTGVKAPTVTVSKGVTTVAAPSGFFATLSGSQFDAVLNALTTDNRARVLSAPSVFTASNQSAKIDISQQIPIPTGTFQTTSGAGTISTSIGYQSVGIVLEVTPRVTQGDIVQMDVRVTANEPGAEVIVADLSYPSINQRLAEANLSVSSGNTVVLGGLMRESITHTATRVPLLGDLPLVGPLFRQTRDGKEKSELLVFLTPYVVRNPAEMVDMSERERDRLWEAPKSLRGSLGGPRAEEAPPYKPALEQPPVVAPESAPPSVPQEQMQAPAATPETPPAAPAPAAEVAPAGPSPAPAPEAAAPTGPTTSPAPTPEAAPESAAAPNGGTPSQPPAPEQTPSAPAQPPAEAAPPTGQP